MRAWEKGWRGKREAIGMGTGEPWDPGSIETRLCSAIFCGGVIQGVGGFEVLGWDELDRKELERR